MFRTIISSIILFASLFAAGHSQEVLITGFPLGVAGDISLEFFKPYYPQLKSIADTLKADPFCFAIVTGGADGTRFEKSHDAQNPGLAVGRAQALRNLLVKEFDIDREKIIIQSDFSNDKGGPNRYASVRVSKELSHLEARIESLENRPPSETRVTEVKEVYNSVSENMGLRLGAGLSTSPFGGIPVVTGAITWKRFVFIEGLFGHTFWDNSFSFENSELATRRRLAGGIASVYPIEKIPVGVAGGWIRIEEISQRYNEYVRMSDGPVIGLQFTPIENLSITAVHNTAKHNILGDLKSKLKNGQFVVFAEFHVLFGGGK